MFKSSPSVSYQNAVEGTWGEFKTPTGCVAFVLTKARLGSSGTDHERRLTAQLRPVREVLGAEQLDFNQLLQRDLDDHRVAEGLIPYLLKPKPTGPAFFPPIMAVLLPFDASKPADAFPAQNFEDAVEDLGAKFEERRYGLAYRVQRLLDTNGKYHAIKLGRLHWNDEYAKLVVLDGQHRAMALLAIDRTLNHLWGTGPGNRFRHFYEGRVRDLLNQADPSFDLNQIEIPVTVCWFPDLNGAGRDPHRAARKLFVDVNKEARTPSEARLTLLSDSELVNIFTRSLLNRLREQSPPLPLYAIEYDNPERDVARPVKWSVLTNLNLLKFGVTRCVFGPTKYITDMRLAFGGRQPWSEMDAFMRAQLDVHTLYENTIKDGDRVITRDSIGNTHFPLQSADKLVGRFMDSWGGAILEVLGRLRPYAAHCRALQHTRDHWIADDAFSSLAHDALFSGVGMYWTLRDSNEHWQELREQCRRENKPEPTSPDIIKAWEALQQKFPDFDEVRAKEYLGKKTEKEVERSRKFFEIVNTHACQLGALMTLASLAYAARKSHVDIARFAEKLVAAWNAALDSKRAAEETRALVLARDPVIKYPLNRLGKMDTPFAVYFRYFWLELLRLEPARDELGDTLAPAVVDELATKARSIYVEYLVDEQIKALTTATAGVGVKDAERLRSKAKENVSKDLARALTHWFAMTKQDAEALISEALKKGASSKTTAAAARAAGEIGSETVEESESSATPPAVTSPKSVSEVLDELPEE
jgi:DNA-sulfur modification-associated